MNLPLNLERSDTICLVSHLRGWYIGSPILYSFQMTKAPFICSSSIQDKFHKVSAIVCSERWGGNSINSMCRRSIKESAGEFFQAFICAVICVTNISRVIIISNKSSTCQGSAISFWKMFTFSQEMRVGPACCFTQDTRLECLLSGWWLGWVGMNTRHALVSPIVFNSSRSDCKPCDISGFSDANVLLQSSVPYFCFTSWGKPGWIAWSQRRQLYFQALERFLHPQ